MTRLRGRPRNRCQDEVREDGRIVGGEGGREKYITERNGGSSWEWQGIIAFCTCQWNEWIHGTCIGMRHYKFHCFVMSFQGLRLCIQDQRQNLCVIVWLLALHTSCVCRASVLEVVAVVQIHALWLQKLYVPQSACHLVCMGNHVQLPFRSDGVSYVLLLIRWSLGVLHLKMWHWGFCVTAH